MMDTTTNSVLNMSGNKWTLRKKLVGVVVSPKRTFKYLVGKPDVLLPLTLLSITTLFMAITITPRAFEASARINHAQMPANLMNLVITFSIVFAVVTAVGGWLITSLFYYFLSSLMGKDTSARATLSVFGYAVLPVMFRSILRTAATLVTKGTYATFRGQIASRSFVGILGNNTDLFIVWSLILSVLAFSIINKISTAKSAMFILTIWFFGLLVQWQIGMRGFNFS